MLATGLFSNDDISGKNPLQTARVLHGPRSPLLEDQKIIRLFHLAAFLARGF